MKTLNSNVMVTLLFSQMICALYPEHQKSQIFDAQISEDYSEENLVYDFIHSDLIELLRSKKDAHIILASALYFNCITFFNTLNGETFYFSGLLINILTLEELMVFANSLNPFAKKFFYESLQDNSELAQKFLPFE